MIINHQKNTAMDWAKEDIHRKIVSIIFGVKAFLSLMGGIILFAFAPLIKQVIENQNIEEQWIIEFLLNVGFSLIGFIALFFMILNSIAAYLIHKKSKGGYIFGIVLSIFGIFNFPIGTIIAGYSIVVLGAHSQEQDKVATTIQ